MVGSWSYCFLFFWFKKAAWFRTLFYLKEQLKSCWIFPDCSFFLSNLCRPWNLLLLVWADEVDTPKSVLRFKEYTSGPSPQPSHCTWGPSQVLPPLPGWEWCFQVPLFEKKCRLAFYLSWSLESVYSRRVCTWLSLMNSKANDI